MLTAGVLGALVALHGWSEQKQAAFQCVSTLHTVVALEEEGVLHKIRDLGVRIAIDDFGTGYSVLSRLQRFPVDTLKIDLSFTRTIVSDLEPSPIVDAMISMGLSLGLKVVAEGVENEVQRRYLVSRRCSELQGYLISRPIGPAELVARFSPRHAVTAG